MRTSWIRAGMPALRLFTLLCLIALAGPASRALADDDPAPGPKPAPEDAAPAPAAETAEDGAPPRPDIQKLYVPFRDLEKIFQKEGEGVFLPYKEFRRLWELAHRLPPDTTTAPVPAAVRSATYHGAVDGETIRFEAALDVEVLAKGWQRVSLDFAGIGIEKATIDGAPALLVPTKRGYDLLLKDAGRRRLDLVLRAGAPAKGDTHTAEFALPPVPLARLALRVPGRDTEVAVTPRLASTTTNQDDATELLAFLGPVSKVKLSWHRKPEDAPTVDPLVFAEETLDVRVDRGVVHTTLRAVLAIRRAPLTHIQVAVPREAVVLYVNGPGIRTWTRGDTGERLDIELRAPVREAYAFQVGLERALPPPPVAAVLPLAAIGKMERERGFLRVQAADGVKLEAKVTPGLMQLDLRDLPKDLQGAAPGKAFAFRFPARPGEVVFDVQSLEPRVSATVGNRVGIRPESLDVRCVAHVTVERAGIFALPFDVPADLEVTEVKVQGAELDDWTLLRAEGKASILRVSLRDRLLGKATVTVDGRTRISISEAEGAAPLKRDLPLVRLRGAHHVHGYVGVHIDPALDHSETRRVGLTSLDVRAPAACEPPALVGEARRLPLVYRFEHREGDVALGLSLRRKAPTITCAVESWVRLEPGKTRMGAMLRYHVAFRGVRTFRFKAPLELAKRLHLDAPSLELIGPAAEVKPEGAGDEWKPRLGVWTVKLPASRTGDVPVQLVLDDQPEPELASGGRRVTAVPSFVPLQDEIQPLPNVSHHVAVRRDALLEVEMVKAEGGEEIDARELPSGLKDEGNFLAFRSFAAEHAVELQVTKHDYEPVADLVVSHMHLDTVVPVEGRATTEAFLVVRNNDRQSLEIKLPPGASIRAVRVGDRSESPRVGQEGTVLIPLTSGLRKDQAFLVALFFDHDIDRQGTLFESVHLVTPVPVGVKSDILTWRVIMPEDRVYTSFGGSVLPVDARRSWAARTLAGITSLVSRPDASQRLDVHALIRGFKSPFTDRRHKGRRFEFQGRVGTGEVYLHSASPTFFQFWKLLWLVVAFLGARFLVRLGRRFDFGAAVAFLAPALLLFALLIPAGPGMAQVLTSMFVGLLISGTASFFRWYASGRQAAQAAAVKASGPEDTPPSAPEDGASPDDASAPQGGVA